MQTIVFVAPLFREATLGYVRAFANLPGLRLAVISQEPASRCPAEVRARFAAHFEVRDALDADEIVRGTRAIARSLGSVDRPIGHLEQLTIPVAIARERLGLEGMGEIAARNFREKSRMKDVRQAGVPVARHKLLTSDDDLRAFVHEVGFPVVVKPLAGLGAKATFRVANAEELADAMRQIRPSPEDPWQAEEFVTGQENTCETVTIHGRPVWRSGTHYIPGPLKVLENAWMQYCVVLPREVDDPDFTTFHPVNTAALRALGMGTGISHMEWFRRRDGSAVVSEVGARPPGAMIMPLMSHAHQVDMWARWAELVAFDRFDAPVRRKAAGCAFFRGQGAGERVVAVHGLERAQEEVGVHVVDRKLPTIGQPRATSYEGEGWAVVTGDDTATVLHALARLINLVRVELG